MKAKENERYLKRVLKRKVSITKAVVVSFLIGGFFGVSSLVYAGDKYGTGNIVNGDTAFVAGNDSVVIGEDALAMSCRQAMVLLYHKGRFESTHADALALAKIIARSRGIDAEAEIAAFKESIDQGRRPEVRKEKFVAVYNKLGMNGAIHPEITKDYLWHNDWKNVPGLTGPETNLENNPHVKENTAVGYGSVASGGFHGKGGTAIGAMASAMGGQSLAVGNLAHAYSDQATAIGSDSYATGFGSVVLGGDDLVGDFHTPDGEIINVGGYKDKLSVSRILAAYVYENSIKFDDTLLKKKSGESKQEWFERLVEGAHYDSNYKVVTKDGKDLEKYLNDNNVTFLKNKVYTDFKRYYLNEQTGRRQYSPSFAAGTGAIALGSRAMAAKKGATALGPLAFALGKESTAMGVRTYVDNDAEGGIAMGIGSHVFAENGLAVGNHSESTEKYSAAFGNLSRAVGEGSLAMGDSSSANGMLTDTSKAKFLKALKTNYENEMSGSRNSTQSIDNILGKDYEFEYKGSGDVYLSLEGEGGEFYDVEATQQKGDYGTAIGHLVLTDADRAIAVGNTSYVGGDRSIGIGATSMVSEKADDSVGIGTGVMLDGVNSVGIGTGANVTDANAMAIGFHTKANAANAQAIGNEAQATLANSTALGVGSRTDYTVEDLKKPGYIPAGSFSMPSSENVGLISVGSIGNERRITNLASGYRDTDAVNVAQLKALANRINYGDDEGDKNAIRYVSTHVSDDVKNILGKEGSYKKVLSLEEQRLRVEAVKASGGKINEAALTELKAEISKEKAKLNVDSLSDEARAKLDAIKDLQFTASQSQEEMNTAIATAKSNAENLIANDGIYTDADKLILTSSNVRNDGAEAEGSIVIGKNAKAIVKPKSSAASSIVIGEGAKASFHEDDRSTAGESIVIGKNAAAGSYVENGHIHDAIAIGTDSKGYGHRAVAIGKEAHIGYSDSVAIGQKTYVMGEGSVAIGQNASVEQKAEEGEERSLARLKHGLALGEEAHVYAEGGVAIGSNSIADRAGFTESTLGKYSDVELKDITLGAVSVGGNGKLRQITNVGDATQDTDAVNLRQLDAAIKTVANSEIEIPITFAGNDGKTERKLGETLKVVGDDKNIITTAVTDGQIKINIDDSKLGNTYTGGKNITIDPDNVIQTKDAVQFGTSVTVGDDKKQNVKIGKDSIQFKKEKEATGGMGDPSYLPGLKISSQGIDMADTEIKNLESVIEGKEGADYLAKLNKAQEDENTKKNAVNVSDLQQTASKLNENITENATDIKNLGDRVTTNEGNITKVTNKVDALNDWSLVADASGSYKVSNDGKVTLQVKDANGKDSTVKNVVIEGIAKSDLGNITNEGNTVIKNLAKEAVQLADGNKTTVTSEMKDGNKIWKVNVTEGNIAAADEGLVSGKKVFDETRVTKDNYNYINKSNTAAANLEALDEAIKGTETTLVDKGLKFGANSGDENPVTNKLGSTIKVVGSGKEVDGKYDSSNIKTKVKKTGDDTEIEVMLSKELALDKVVVGEKGKDGAPGKPGSIGINGKDGKSAEITVAKGQDGVDGTNGKDGITRIVYDNHEVATMEDGLKFKGDSGDVVKKKLNETLHITGGEKVATNLTENNIGITNDEQKGLVVKLAKDIDLGNEGSLTIAGNKYIGKDGINAGSKVITNVKSSIAEEAGAKYSDKLVNANTNNPNNAVNVSDLHGVADEINKDIATKTFGLTADGKKATRTLGNEIGVSGDDNLTVAIDGTEEGKANLKLSVNKAKLVENIYNDTTLVNKIEGKTKISYTSNGGDPKKTVSLKDGFNFKRVDDVTTVTAGANGEVTFGLDKKITDKIDGAIQGLTNDDKTVTLNPTTGKGNSIDLAVNIDGSTIKKVAKGQTNEGQLYVDAKGVADKIFNNNDVINNTTIDDSVYNKFESGMDLAYKANGTNSQSVKLNKGLDFKNGTYTTATVGKDGVVTFDINADKATEFTAKSREVVKANPETDGYITVTPEGTGPDNLVYKVGFDKTKLEGEFDKKYIQQWTLKQNDSEITSIGNKGTVNFVNGDNILITDDNSAENAGKIKISTSPTPTFTSVTAGDTLMNGSGITITGGPIITKTNINMAGQQIHNVKKGGAGTDAVNVDQLKDAIDAINTEIGGVSTNVISNQVVVYTTTDGDIIVPFVDEGVTKYYKKDDLDALGKPKEGVTAVPENTLETRVVNPEYENTKNEMILGNVGSSIDKHIKAADAKQTEDANKIIKPDMTPEQEAQAKVKYLLGDNLTANPASNKKVVNVKDLKDLAMAGLDFVGNDENNVHKNIGETLTIVGEGVDKAATASEKFKSAEGNIAVVENDTNDGLVVKMNQDLININSISHKDGAKITLDGDNITLSGDKNTTIKIKGVTAGTDETDAVNKKQIDDLTIKYKANNVANDKDGNKVEPVKLSDGLDFTNGAHTTAEIAANGVVKFNVKEGSIANDKTGDELVTGKTVFDEVRVPVKQKPDGSSAYNVINSENTAAKNIEALDTAVGNKLDKGSINKIKGAGLAKVVQEDITKADVTVNVSKEDVKKAAQESLAEGTNISLSKDKSTGVTTIATAKDVTFDKVTVGDIVVDKNTGINAGNKEITNVKSAIKDIPLDPNIESPSFKDRIVAANKNEATKESAVNVSDLYSATTEINTNIDKKTFGVKVDDGKEAGTFDTATRTLDNELEVKGDGNITVSIDGKNDPTKAALKLEVDKAKLVENIYKDTTLVEKIEGATSIKYKANSKNEQTVTLAKGLNFTDGTHTTAEVAKDGVVKFHVKEGSIANDTNGNEFVTGKTVFTEVRVPGTGSDGATITYNALKAGNTTSQNLVALDKATTANKEAYEGIGVIKVAGDAGLKIDTTSNGSLKGHDVTITLNKATIGDIAADKFKAGTNIEFTKDGTSGVTTIATAKNVTFEKVTVGDIVVDKSTGINAGDLGITNIKSAIDGQLSGQTDKTFLDKLNAAQGDSKTAKNAVNVSDLQQTASKLTENITNVKNVADTALQNITSSDKTVIVDKQGTTVDLKVNIDGTTVVKDDSTGVISVGKITGENITNNSITGDHIANNTIKEGNIDNSLIQKLSEKTVLKKGTHTTLTGDGSKTNPYVVDVVTDGAISSENTGIVTGGTVYTETRVQPKITGTYNYIVEDKSAAENLVNLDTKIGNKFTTVENSISSKMGSWKLKVNDETESYTVDNNNDTVTLAEGDNVTIKREDGKVTISADVTGAVADLSGVVKYDKNVDGTINKDKVTLEGEGGTTITNIKSSVENITVADNTNPTYVEKLAEAAKDHGKDAVNVSDLHNVSSELAGDISKNAGDITNLDTKLTNNYYDKTHIDGLSLNYKVEEGEKKSVNLKDGVLKFIDDGNLEASYGKNGEIKYGLSSDILDKINNIHNDGDTVITNEYIYYKANGGTTEKVKLTEGLDFTNGTYTTAEVAGNGKVTIDVNETKLNDKIEDVVNNHTVVNVGEADINAGKNVNVSKTKDDKGVVTAIKINVDSELKDIKSISNGSDGAKVTLSSNENKVDFTNDNGDNATLTGVAAGEVSETSTDAVNGSQLYAVDQKVNYFGDAIQNNARNINKLSGRVNKVGALSAALAGLHPMQYDPMHPNQVMAAMGAYRDSQAVAVGMTHYFNENLMMNGGLSVEAGGNSSSEVMANVGFTWKLGKDEDRENLELPGRYDGKQMASIYMMQTEMDKVLYENEKEKIKNQELQLEVDKYRKEVMLQNLEIQKQLIKNTKLESEVKKQKSKVDDLVERLEILEKMFK